MITLTVTPVSVSTGRSGWCSKCGRTSRSRSGSAVHSWTPCRTGEWSARALLGVGDAVAGGHEVQLARPDQLHAADAVAVQHLALDQPAHRLQPGVRVRRDVHAGRVADVVRPVVVDEAPGPDHPPARGWAASA